MCEILSPSPALAPPRRGVTTSLRAGITRLDPKDLQSIGAALKPPNFSPDALIKIGGGQK
jgi:hypothetical protein